MNRDLLISRDCGIIISAEVRRSAGRCYSCRRLTNPYLAFVVKRPACVDLASRRLASATVGKHVQGVLRSIGDHRLKTLFEIEPVTVESNEQGKTQFDRKKRRHIDFILSYRRQLAESLKPLLGGRCQRCGYSDCDQALDFHHIDPNEKESNIGRLLKSKGKQAVLREIDKCCLLCANCHRELHACKWTPKFVHRTGLGWTIDT